ncbi:hypothetical protein ACH5RR_032660 [Cinchona calisaya]|uniref:Uncharacterized protein n=1 Tax=Cinchona calisaya TaxID=153742 RepID=A0ABD2YJV3_9GENT
MTKFLNGRQFLVPEYRLSRSKYPQAVVNFGFPPRDVASAERYTIAMDNILEDFPEVDLDILENPYYNKEVTREVINENDQLFIIPQTTSAMLDTNRVMNLDKFEAMALILGADQEDEAESQEAEQTQTNQEVPTNNP